MKRKFLLIAVLVGIAVVGILLFAPITIEIKRQVRVDAPTMTVAAQITDLKNWPRWHAYLKNRDSGQIKMSPRTNAAGAWIRSNNLEIDLLQQNTSYIVAKQTGGKWNRYHSIFSVPDSVMGRTDVIWVENVAPLGWLFEKFNPHDLVQKSLDNLKAYLEDVKKFYGFDIRLQSVPDTLVICKKTIASRKNLTPVMTKMYRQLSDFAAKQNLGASDQTVRMANLSAINRDSVKIMVAMPVLRKAALQDDISYLEMPPKGKMLIGYYQGDYKNIGALYLAMSRYIADHRLQIIAAPYERYLTRPVTPQDSIHMKLQLCYPIF